jgi:hypothetical protein
LFQQFLSVTIGNLICNSIKSGLYRITKRQRVS